MASDQKRPHGPPMDLANMRRQRVRGLAVCCLNHPCLYRTVINVDDYR
jgi:hypothetical protein